MDSPCFLDVLNFAINRAYFELANEEFRERYVSEGVQLQFKNIDFSALTIDERHQFLCKVRDNYEQLIANNEELKLYQPSGTQAVLYALQQFNIEAMFNIKLFVQEEIDIIKYCPIVEYNEIIHDKFEELHASQLRMHGTNITTKFRGITLPAKHYDAIYQPKYTRAEMIEIVKGMLHHMEHMGWFNTNNLKQTTNLYRAKKMYEKGCVMSLWSGRVYRDSTKGLKRDFEIFSKYWNLFWYPKAIYPTIKKIAKKLEFKEYKLVEENLENWLGDSKEEYMNKYMTSQGMFESFSPSKFVSDNMTKISEYIKDLISSVTAQGISAGFKAFWEGIKILVYSAFESFCDMCGKAFKFVMRGIVKMFSTVLSLVLAIPLAVQSVAVFIGDNFKTYSSMIMHCIYSMIGVKEENEDAQNLAEFVEISLTKPDEDQVTSHMSKPAEIIASIMALASGLCSGLVDNPTGKKFLVFFEKSRHSTTLLNFIGENGIHVANAIAYAVTGDECYKYKDDVNYVAELLDRCDSLIRDHSLSRNYITDVQMAKDIEDVFYDLHSKYVFVYTNKNLDVALKNAFVRTYSSMIKMVKDIRGKSDLYTKRCAPMWVSMQGDPEQGKGTLLQALCSLLKYRLSKLYPNKKVYQGVYTQQDVYNMQQSDQYWSGYSNQWICNIDELGASQYPQLRAEVAAMLLQIVNDGVCKLNMAGLEDKDSTYFTSEIVTTTTNMKDFNDMQLESPAAFMRRINFPLKVVRTAQFIESKQNFDESWRLYIQDGGSMKGTCPHPYLLENCIKDEQGNRYVTFSICAEAMLRYMITFNSEMSLGNKLATFDWGEYDLRNNRPLEPIYEEREVVANSNVENDPAYWVALAHKNNILPPYVYYDMIIKGKADVNFKITDYDMNYYRDTYDEELLELCKIYPDDFPFVTSQMFGSILNKFNKWMWPDQDEFSPDVSLTFINYYCKLKGEYGVSKHQLKNFKMLCNKSSNGFGEYDTSIKALNLFKTMLEFSQEPSSEKMIELHEVLVTIYPADEGNEIFARNCFRIGNNFLVRAGFEPLDIEADKFLEKLKLGYLFMIEKFSAIKFITEQGEAEFGEIECFDSMIDYYKCLNNCLLEYIDRGHDLSRAMTMIEEQVLNFSLTITYDWKDILIFMNEFYEYPQNIMDPFDYYNKVLWKSKVKVMAKVGRVIGMVGAGVALLVALGGIAYGLIKSFRLIPTMSQEAANLDKRLADSPLAIISHSEDRTSHAKVNKIVIKDNRVTSAQALNGIEAHYDFIFKNIYLAKLLFDNGPEVITHILFLGSDQFVFCSHMQYNRTLSHIVIKNSDGTDAVRLNRDDFKLDDKNKEDGRDLVIVYVRPYMLSPKCDMKCHLVSKPMYGGMSAVRAEKELDDNIVTMRKLHTDEWFYDDKRRTFKSLNVKGFYYNNTYLIKGGVSKLGDCVLPYLTKCDKLENKQYVIVGIHIGANEDRVAFAAPLYSTDVKTPDEIRKMFNSPIAQPNIYERLEISMTSQMNLPGLQSVGQIEGSFYMANKQEFRPTPFNHKGSFMEVDTAPTRLAPFVNEEGKRISPFLKSVRFAERQRPEECHWTREMKSLLDNRELRSGFDGGIKYRPTFITKEDSVFGNKELGINEMPRDTSIGVMCPGFKTNVGNRKQIFDYEAKTIQPEFAAEVDKMMKAAEEGLSPIPFMGMQNKSELTSLEKHRLGKTRLFMVSDLVHVVWLKMIFGMLVAMLKSDWPLGRSAVGVNPHGLGWKHIYNTIKQFGFGNIIGGDMSIFDIGSLRWILVLFFQFCNTHFMFQEGTKEYNVLLAAVNSLYSVYMVYGNKVYRFNDGNPSGQWLTSFINSFLCFTVLKAIFIVNRPDSNLVFEEHVKGFSFGDDNINGVSPTVSSWFNNILIEKEAKRIFGMVYTDPDKGGFKGPFLSSEQVTFLGRTFREEGPFVLAPLRLTALSGMLHWTRDEYGSNKIFGDNLNNVLRESFHYGPEFFGKMRSDIINELVVTNTVIEVELLSYDYIYDRIYNSYFENDFVLESRLWGEPSRL